MLPIDRMLAHLKYGRTRSTVYVWRAQLWTDDGWRKYWHKASTRGQAAQARRAQSDCAFTVTDVLTITPA